MPSGTGRSVPFLDVGATYRELQPELDAAWRRVMASGWYVLGAELSAFEQEWASYVDAAEAVGVGSGLDALVLALRALDVGPGHEVLVPSNTYIATWLAVSAVGATPVPVEPDPATHNMDPHLIEAAITPRTRAVLPVHLYGQPVDLDPIIAIAAAHELLVVTDAAQAHGARYHGQALGGVGDATCWSFYPGKNLGAYGDGGAVSTSSPAVADRLRSLRNYGSRVKYVNDERGVNSRLDELQAALLRVKLAHLDEWTTRRTTVAAAYLEHLRGLDGLVLPEVLPGTEPAWHLFVVRCADRDQLQADLTARGVQTSIHYPIPPHLQVAYEDLGALPPLPLAERLADEVLSLPIGPHLDEASVSHVIEAVRASLA